MRQAPDPILRSGDGRTLAAMPVHGFRRLRSLVGRRVWVCGLAGTGLSLAALALLGPEPALFALASTVLVWALVPAAAAVARRLEIVAHPGGRGIHRRTTPLLGGAALALPLLLAVACGVGHQSPKSLGLLGAVVSMLLVGIVDDVWGLRARTKLPLQLAAAGALYLGGYRLEALNLEPLGTWSLGWLEIPFLLLWVAGVTNAFNMVDGIDGLAGSLAVAGAVAAALAGSDPLLAMAVAGASVGFLRHNLPRAKVFLGDTGSLVLGISTAALTLDVPRTNNLALALGIVAYPVGDMLLSIVRRTLRAKPPFTPDRSHLHHKILHESHSPVRTVVVLFLFALLQAGIALSLPGAWALPLMAALWIGLVGLVMKTCNVQLGDMIANRKHFIRLHAARSVLLEGIRAAGGPEDVHGVIDRIPGQLGLHAVEFNGTRALGGPPDESVVVHRVPLRMRGGEAAWEYAPRSRDHALDRELHAVVSELLREADRRLRAVGPGGARESAPSVSRDVRSPDLASPSPGVGGPYP